MIVVTSPRDLRALIRQYREQGHTMGLVPTMGALHKGHASLIEKSKSENHKTLLTIFVNPAQFAPNEDLSKYPRPFEEDLDLARGLGVDLVFAPTETDMYPPGYSVYAEDTLLSQVLCGAYRPGHFRGVCTIVLKLINLTAPHRLYLGQKDAQQLRIIEKMAEDLHLEVQIVGCPTVREDDGLAMSSRNRYLSPRERDLAPAFYKALVKAKHEFMKGERTSHDLLRAAHRLLDRAEGLKLQYLEIRRWRDFEEVDVVEDVCILAGALFLGTTRLIDNVFLDPKQP